MSILNFLSVLFSRISLYILFFSLLFPTASCLAGQDNGKETFPKFESILPNIAFWERIYSTYSKNTALVHDQDHLDRVYEVVSLTDESQPQARRKNEKLLEKKKKHYSRLLLKLAGNTKPRNTEEMRVLTLFGSNPSPDELRRAADNIRAQQGLKEPFAEGVIRSGAYLDELKRTFRKHGLPEDLAYLPHVESSFNPGAFSRFGAAGMWQFTHATGKQFMRIDYIIDERRDPLISGDAAARFLKRNYQLLGSWPLALTAYNYGPAGMKRAVSQEGSYEAIFRNYRQGWFKFASRNFYSEFLAAINVAKKMERSNRMRLDPPLPSISIKLPGFADAAKFCGHFQINFDVLRLYNPALREPVYQGTKYIPKDYLVKLPARFKGSSLLAGAPASIFESRQKRSKFYQVKPGDTAGAIALAHNITLGDLIQANNLDNRALIRVNQNLRIPQSGRPPSTSGGTGVNIVQASGGPILRDSKKTAPAPLLARTYKEDITVIGNLKVFNISQKERLISGRVEVQPDESIWLFADWLKVTPESIKAGNSIPASSALYPGQTIILDFLNISIENFEETRFDFHQEKQEDFFNSYAIVGVKSYQVENGDTIWELCNKKFDIPLWLLKKYNDKLNFNRLDPADNLQIPIVKQI